MRLIGGKTDYFFYKKHAIFSIQENKVNDKLTQKSNRDN